MAILCSIQLHLLGFINLTIQTLQYQTRNQILLKYMAAKQELTQLLQTLRLKSIEDLITGDYFNLEHLSKSTSLHPILIHQQLNQIHTLLTTKQLLADQPDLELDAIVARWQSEKMNESEKIDMKQRVSRGDIVEIIGRANAGKSYLFNELIVQALSKSFEVIFLDSGNNLPALMIKLKERLGHLPNYKFLKLRHFKFASLCQLFMLLHHIKLQIQKQGNFEYFIFIDTLSRHEQPQIQNLQTISSHEFKYAQKAKILLRLLSSKVRGVVYTSKVSHSISMFDTIYKHEKLRPKAFGINSKQWDNIANKTILVDFTTTQDGYEHWWLHSSKSLDASVYKFKRQI